MRELTIQLLKKQQQEWEKMGLLKLADDNPDIDFYEYRDQHYYNKYEYRARFVLVGVRYTWHIKSDIQELIDRLDSPAVGYNRIVNERDTVRGNLQILASFIKWRNELQKKKNSSIRIEHNTVGVFSNDLQELKNIVNCIPGITVDYTQAQISNFIGIKHFVNKPKHKFRVYLKSKRVESSFAEELDSLFKKNEKLYPCESLKIWVKGSKGQQNSWRFRFSNATHFIDYDDESTLSYLALLYGDILGKRYKLEKRPDPI
jgi:hypothetical protein